MIYMKKKRIFTALLSILVMLLSAADCLALQSNASFSLMYHRLSENEEEFGEYTTSPQNFEEDIKYLTESGYTVCSARDASKLMKSNSKVCIITFDDGYESDLKYALPILEKYNAGATFFVIGKYVGTDGYMTKDMLSELSSSKNAEIGSHSYFCHLFSFEDVKKIQSLYPTDYAKDFLKNASFLEAVCQKKITSLSYPYGAYTDYLNDIFCGLGFTTFSSKETVITSGSAPIPRFNRSHKLSAKDIFETRVIKQAPSSPGGYSPIKKFF